MTESKRERIPGLYSRKTEGPTIMLFSSEGGDVSSEEERRWTVCNDRKGNIYDPELKNTQNV